MTFLIWAAFIAFILAMLALDLGVLQRRDHVIGIRESLIWTGIWVALSLLFNAGVYFAYEHHWLGIGTTVAGHLSGSDAALKFFTGYVIEKSLSLDNIFVIAVIFAYFGVPGEYQHRVLYWGILGALVMRGAMIGAGTALIHALTWITYVFGAMLIVTAIRMYFSKDKHVDPDRNPFVRAARSLYPVSGDFEGHRFFTRIDGARAITPLFLVLLVIESTDLLFAVDSIPAIFAITDNAFIVFTSNVFAILGLRSLYFALAGIIRKFRYLRTSLVFVLGFVGVKMLLAHYYPIPTGVSLAVIAGMLAIGITASIVANRRARDPENGNLGADVQRVVQATWKQARRIVVLVVGMTVLAVGAALLILPGPALIVLPIGLAILATEFVWARRLLRRIKSEAGSLAEKVGVRKSTDRKSGEQGSSTFSKRSKDKDLPDSTGSSTQPSPP